ncbi:unnamed protein product [Cladocopium goreaui]|uniref:Delta(24)-sterol reductase n=1 Tax=Cladocopium goreaui TaxID=2562237 RepID=A0A9P1G030_9DINO|nr:unnamed protein product [Cladocopium goreaui]
MGATRPWRRAALAALCLGTLLALPAFVTPKDQVGARWPTLDPEPWEEFMARMVGAPDGPRLLSQDEYATGPSLWNEALVSDAQQQLLRLHKRRCKAVTLEQTGNAASLFGHGRLEYHQKHGRLNIAKLSGVIDFDSATGVVRVGAKTDFKLLTRFLLPEEFIPPVVPEVDSVTVGGAIAGLVMESSSFRYGFLHNAVVAMDVLLANGTVVSCSRTEHPELFAALPHSYGTLGYVLSASLQAVPAERDVLVTVREHPSIKEAVDDMSVAMQEPSVDFVDGLIFGQDRGMSITASMVPSPSRRAAVVLPDDGRFVDILQKKLEERPAGQRDVSFVMSTFDYLYRWDCDIFWSTRRVDVLGKPDVRQFLGRAFLRSKILWHFGRRARDAKEFVSRLVWQLVGERGADVGFRPPTERIIQDLGVRLDQVPSFAKGLEQHGELPFWMCPVRVVAGEQPLFPLPDVEHIMDVACFGAVPCGGLEDLYHNKGIDRWLAEFDGQKAFYSDVTFSREYLYQKYAGAKYDQLKAQLDPEGVLPHLFDKVLVTEPEEGNELTAALGETTLAAEIIHSALEPYSSPNENSDLKAALKDCCAFLAVLEVKKLEAAQTDDSKVLPPRFSRVVKRLELSEKEVKAFEHALVLQCLPDKFRELKSWMELAAYAKLSPSELVRFAQKSRAHFKQGILTDVTVGFSGDPDRHPDDELVGQAVFTNEAAKALTGAQLSVTERLKVDDGALAEVLREEGGDEAEALKEAAKEAEAEEKSSKEKRPSPEDVVNGTAKKAKLEEPSDADAAVAVAKAEPAAEAEDLCEDLFDIINSERRRDEQRAEAKEELTEVIDEGKLTPYKTDLEYLVDAVELVSRKGRLYQVKQKLEEKKSSIDDEDNEESYQDTNFGLSSFLPRPRNDAGRERRQARELEGQVKQLSRKMEERMRLTKQIPNAWIPRLERILSSRHMNEFEKEVVVLLVGLILLPNRFQIRGTSMYHHCRGEPVDVATVLVFLSPDLASQIANRKAFYKDAVLVRDHIIHVSTKGVHGDLASCPVEIDRRMVDFIVGLDSEMQQLVDGSHLYLPQTKMEAVVLPEETKILISKTVQSLSLFKKSKHQFKLDETISSSGLVMLFYGDSGTGKTMTANAIANLLGKKLLLINFPSLGGEQACPSLL